MSPFFGYSSTSPTPGSNRAFAAALASFALTSKLLLLAFLALLLFLLRLLADVAKFVEEPCVSHDSVRKVRACISHDSVRSVRACIAHDSVRIVRVCNFMRSACMGPHDHGLKNARFASDGAKWHTWSPSTAFMMAGDWS